MGISTSSDREAALREDLSPLATDDISVEAIVAQALPDGKPEFRPHFCWRMLFIYPDPDLPNEPGEARCQGCGRSWGMVEEYRP
jgi:hypothetical protein